MSIVLGRKPGASGGGGGGGTPGGSDGQVQYNNGGAFGGAAGLTYNDTTREVVVDSFAGVPHVAQFTDRNINLNGAIVAGNQNDDLPDTAALVVFGFSGTEPSLEVTDGDFNDMLVVTSDAKIGFFGETPVVQPAAPTTINEVITALQDLGLVDT